MKKTALISAVLFAAPLFALADTGLTGLIAEAQSILNSLIPLLMAAALVVFFWGLVQYIRSSGEGAPTTGRNIMIAGSVSLFVMVSVWGPVRFLQTTLHVDGSQGVGVPCVPGKGGSG